MAQPTVVIVGAGFTGTLLALHLLRRDEGPDVVLLERTHAVGRGVAYSSRNPNHRLNVPAERMSAFADDPDDFLRWLAASGHEGGPGDFVPRWLFGDYVRQRLGEAIRDAPGRLDILDAEARSITVGTGGGWVQLDCGRRIQAEQIALAMGNRCPQRLAMADEAFAASGCYRDDPWRGDALSGLSPEAPVLLVGTGLTMVDVVTSLLDAGHTGPIRAISRRGLLPLGHVPAPPHPFVPCGSYPADLVPLMRRLRREARVAASSGLPWQAVIDCVRHHVQEIWCGLSETDRRRFLRHARPWWDIHRHRIAPAIAERIGLARQTGQLRVAAGRIRSLTAHAGMAEIVYMPRGRSTHVQVHATRVINCTGPAGDTSRSDDPLIQDLIAQGAARPDALKLGFDVDRGGEVIGADGGPTPGLYAVGPITKGTWWEIVAVPDIRRECARVADRMCREMRCEGRLEPSLEAS